MDNIVPFRPRRPPVDGLPEGEEGYTTPVDVEAFLQDRSRTPYPELFGAVSLFAGEVVTYFDPPGFAALSQVHRFALVGAVAQMQAAMVQVDANVS